MKEKKFRHELKHYINTSDYLGLKQRLKVITTPDPHTGFEGKYKIRSLYFDNINDKALKEKIYGINNREKFRIRYYNDDFSYIKLEKKSKINGLCNKVSERLTKEECEKIINGDLAWMRECMHPLVVELYAKMKYQQLRPKTVVDYIREPFIYKMGNVRITLDSNIRTGIYSRDLFNVSLPTISVDRNKVIILEVKYDEYIPDIIRDIVQVNNRKCTAFSKYAACRIYG
ncbi:polyphosphate polymerase domain-containing protein [Clostridium cylindrosporum]|uniref:VTC domain-containing protein n=1 Tax=Clostridium cylindrosporum DSM 605 TaxID=1121307 RepID=A0A0J8DDS7_CLOCY|nr:polyphosphate polymerase domain-containing protein [Clostridium cylindrosporum]KMT22378.1 hypothetical protein CLCY_13c00130 [Clostridium cylindrosporum DSM 605]